MSIHVKSKINIRDGSGVTRTDEDKGGNRETSKIHRRRKRRINRSHAPDGNAGPNVSVGCGFEWQLREAGPALPGWPVLGRAPGSAQRKAFRETVHPRPSQLKVRVAPGVSSGAGSRLCAQTPTGVMFKGKFTRRPRGTLRVWGRGVWAVDCVPGPGAFSAIVCLGQVSERMERC